MDELTKKRFTDILGKNFPEKLMIPGTKGHPDRVTMDCNYTNDPKYEGYWPVFLGREDDKDCTPATVDMMKKSIDEREHSGGQNIVYPIDTGHGAFKGNQLILGEINPDNVVVLDAKDVIIPDLKPLPEGSNWFLVKPEWYLDEYKNISHGKYGYRPSISRDPTTKAFLNLALCQVPAIEETPPIALYSKTAITTISNTDMSFGKELKMIQDEALLVKVKEIFSQMGIPTEKIDQIVQILDDTDGAAIVGSIKVDEPTEPVQESKPLDDLQATVNALSEQINNLKLENEKSNEIVQQYSKKMEEIEKKFTVKPFTGYSINPKKEEAFDLQGEVSKLMAKGLTYTQAVAETLKKRGK